jgi:hypothetical protein
MRTKATVLQVDLPLRVDLQAAGRQAKTRKHFLLKKIAFPCCHAMIQRLNCSAASEWVIWKGILSSN